MPWRPKSGFGHDPKILSLPSILCSKGCHYQFLAPEIDLGHGVWVNGKNTKTEQAINAGKLIREYYS